VTAAQTDIALLCQNAFDLMVRVTPPAADADEAAVHLLVPLGGVFPLSLSLSLSLSQRVCLCCFRRCCE
jgi:hypothetical protein